MKCPYCGAENLVKRDVCYNCEKDISMLRLIVNKSRHHYNRGLEHAERQRYSEAVAELISAIELDKSFVNSYVVLGTVYMKMDQPERAREVWQQALALDPSIHKSHQYLIKIGYVGEINARVRLLRNLIALTCVCLLTGGGLLFYFLYPDRQRVRFDQAIALYEAGDHTAALNAFAGLNDTFRYPRLKALGANFITLINRELDDRLERIEQLIQFGEYYPAVELIDKMNAENLPAVYRQTLGRQRAQAFQGRKNSFAAKLAAVEQTLNGFETLQTELERFGEYFTDREALAFQQSAKAVIENTRARRKFHDFNAGLENLADPLEKLRRLRRFEEQNPIRLAELTQRCETLKQELLQDRKAQFAAAMERGDLQRATELNDERDAWLGLLDEQTARTVAALWPQELRELRVNLIAGELERLTFQNAGRLLELEEQLPRLQLPAERAAELTRRIGDLKTQFAAQILRHCGELENELFAGTVAEADARLIAEQLPRLQTQLPPFTLQYARDNLLYYTAAANATLGQAQLAAELYQRLLKEFPASRCAALAREKLNKPAGSG